MRENQAFASSVALWQTTTTWRVGWALERAARERTSDSAKGQLRFRLVSGW